MTPGTSHPGSSVVFVQEQLDQLETSLAERRQRMNDMHEQRGRLTRRREQLQQELQRAQATLSDLRRAAEGILEDSGGGMPLLKPQPSASGCLTDGAPAAVSLSTSPGADVNAAAENSVLLLRANLQASGGGGRLPSRHLGGMPDVSLAETRACGLPLDHSHFERMPTMQAAGPPAFAHQHYGMH